MSRLLYFNVSSFMGLNRNICSLRRTANNMLQLERVVRTTEPTDFHYRGAREVQSTTRGLERDTR